MIIFILICSYIYFNTHLFHLLASPLCTSIPFTYSTLYHLFIYINTQISLVSFIYFFVFIRHAWTIKNSYFPGVQEPRIQSKFLSAFFFIHVNLICVSLWSRDLKRRYLEVKERTKGIRTHVMPDNVKKGV